MSDLVKKSEADIVEKVLISGDLASLSTEQRISYYNNVCSSLGLNPLTKPFDYIKLNGKLTLYAKRDATDQLRKVHNVSVTISDRALTGDIYVVTARAKNKEGREDESVGAVNIKGLVGDALANAYMKAETKAKRRVTLSICGLGLLDETEVETIPKDVTPAKEALAQAAHEKNVDQAFQKSEAKFVQSLDPAKYVITFGKHKGKKLEDMDIFDLNSYVHYILDKAEKENQPIRGQVKIFIEKAQYFLDSRDSRQKDIDSFLNDPMSAEEEAFMENNINRNKRSPTTDPRLDSDYRDEND